MAKSPKYFHKNFHGIKTCGKFSKCKFNFFILSALGDPSGDSRGAKGFIYQLDYELFKIVICEFLCVTKCPQMQ